MVADNYRHLESLDITRYVILRVSARTQYLKTNITPKLKISKFDNFEKETFWFLDPGLCRCIKITDGCLQHVMVKCSGLKSLNLYALSRYPVELSWPKWNVDSTMSCWTIWLIKTSIFILFSFTDEAYKKISLLAHLEFLDLCGAQVYHRLN